MSETFFLIIIYGRVLNGSLLVTSQKESAPAESLIDQYVYEKSSKEEELLLKKFDSDHQFKDPREGS